ncbi:MAG: hypothetical protein KF791_05335 [Verrucomicrobiae bacterium]|nr:hypothetical protein [Verrucomicrobiae bacterium]
MPCWEIRRETTPHLRRRPVTGSSPRRSAGPYALCGFANLGSVDIQIGGISALATTRRGDLARLGLRAMAAGLLACYLTAGVIT